MKKKLKLLIFILVILIVFLIVFLYIQKNSNKIILKQNEFVYELGDNISSDMTYYIENIDTIKNNKKYDINTDDLKIKNGNFVAQDDSIVPVGTYTIEISIEKNTKQFLIKVVDTTSPKFVNTKDIIEVEEGNNSFDLKSFFEVEDYSDVTLQIKGDYDINNPADYNLIIEAKDKFGNISSFNFVLKVLKKEKEPENTSNSNSVQKPNNNVSNNNQTNNSKEDYTTTSSNGYKKSISDSYVVQINNYRKEKGLSELPVTAEAQAEADRRAKELVTNYSHSGSGYGFGEIIGYGDAGGDFITAWKNSPSHNATILREQSIGIAASVYESDGIWYAVVVFRMNY